MYEFINATITDVPHLESGVLFVPNTHISFSAFSPELSEAQQKLLVKSTEKKILPVELKLVRKSGRCSGEFGRESARTSGETQI